MMIVAEGVESVEQQAILGVAGCELLQGYLYSPPLPASDLETCWLTTTTTTTNLNNFDTEVATEVPVVLELQ
jgi:sensor c-di-GMP phosphodiesterase-like protein